MPCGAERTAQLKACSNKKRCSFQAHGPKGQKFKDIQSDFLIFALEVQVNLWEFYIFQKKDFTSTTVCTFAQQSSLQISVAKFRSLYDEYKLDKSKNLFCIA